MPIARKTLRVLILLLEQPGEVVSRNDIFSGVWQDTFVEENTLARHIAMLRKTLGNSPAGEPYIHTVTGRGYQFVADVRVFGSIAAARAASGPEPHDVQSQAVEGAVRVPAALPSPPLARFNWRTTQFWLAAVLVALVALPFFWFRSTPSTSIARPPRLLTHDRGIQEGSDVGARWIGGGLRLGP